MSAGTVSQWMISVQYLGLKKHSSVLGLAEVHFYFVVLEVSDIFNFLSACCTYLH
jgi:hypothetical protein